MNIFGKIGNTFIEQRWLDVLDMRYFVRDIGNRMCKSQPQKKHIRFLPIHEPKLKNQKSYFKPELENKIN